MYMAFSFIPKRLKKNGVIFGQVVQNRYPRYVTVIDFDLIIKLFYEYRLEIICNFLEVCAMISPWCIIESGCLLNWGYINVNCTHILALKIKLFRRFIARMMINKWNSLIWTHPDIYLLQVISAICTQTHSFSGDHFWKYISLISAGSRNEPTIAKHGLGILMMSCTINKLVCLHTGAQHMRLV